MWANTAHQAEKFARNSERESITMQFIKTDAARTKGHRQLQLLLQLQLQLHRCVCVCVHIGLCVCVQERIWVILPNTTTTTFWGHSHLGYAAVPIKLKYFWHKSNSKLGQAKTNELTINDCPDTWSYIPWTSRGNMRFLAIIWLNSAVSLKTFSWIIYQCTFWMVI